jgi:hypothetical protein
MATTPRSKNRVPDSVSPEQSKPPRLCYARRHMPAAVLAFYLYALSISSRSGIFYSNSYRDAWEFGCSRTTIIKWTKILRKEGWFDPINKSGRRPRRNALTGTFESVQFRVVSHPEWATGHKGKCRFPKKCSPSTESGLVPRPETELGLETTESSFCNHLDQKMKPPSTETGPKNEERERKESFETHTPDLALALPVAITTAARVREKILVLQIPPQVWDEWVALCIRLNRPLTFISEEENLKKLEAWQAEGISPEAVIRRALRDRTYSLFKSEKEPKAPPRTFQQMAHDTTMGTMNRILDRARRGENPFGAENPLSRAILNRCRK